MASVVEHRVESEGWLLRNAPAVAAAFAALGILLVHADTVASIVAIWRRSETFAHGFVVVPIALWLAWRKREEIAAVPARPWLPALAVVALAGALWLVAVAADVIGVRQFALAFMVLAAIVAVVGLDVARAAAFPLLFVLFAVPAGEMLLPVLIDWTADFTVWALRASGVPVFREANHFVIPSGNWSVVEACSGLRYLIASLMIGVVYAAVAYRHPWRRAAFIAASIVVPIIANWLRAYMIVMIGHLSNNTLAVGVDHIIYGWVFFGVVMALLFWVGSFWSEPDAPSPPRGSSRASGLAQATGGALRAVPAARFLVVAAAAIVLAAVWRPFSAGTAPTPSAVTPVLAPIATAGGWTASAASVSEWAPGYAGESAKLRQAFERPGAVAGMQVVYYRNQAKGRELVTSGNQLVSQGAFRWREVEVGPTQLRFGAAPAEARRTVISDARHDRLVAYSLYWVDGTVTSSDFVAKARLAWSRLAGGSGDAALVVFFAPEGEGREPAREAMEALSPAVLAMLEAARSQR
jgi:exosortase A